MREHWGSRLGFVLAIAGSAIGLGNIWKFPYMCGMNGGGAYVLIYIICVLLVGLPLFLAELTLGRATQTSTVGAFCKFTPAKTLLADVLGGFLTLTGLTLIVLKSYGFGISAVIAGALMLILGWKAIGYISGLFIPIAISSYYAVIGGWTLIYIFKSFAGKLNFNDAASAEAAMVPIVNADGDMKKWVIIAMMLFVVLSAGVILSGVKKGIERWSKILMPTLFALLIVLIIRGLTLPGAINGLKFFLYPDFSKLSTDSVIAAMGQSFFTLSIGMGIVLTYGSYLNSKENIIKSAFTVVGLDTLAALMAGVAIFPAVFAMGFSESSGPVLIYQILPVTFNHIPGGLSWLWNGIFFLMIAIAAFTSEMSILEPPVRICVDEFRWSRKVSVCVVTAVSVLLGVFCALSMNNWDHLPGIRSAMVWAWGESGISSSLFEATDNLCCKWLMPIGGMLMSIYIGWIWGMRHALKELHHGVSDRINGNLWLLLSGIKDTSGSEGRKYSLFSFSVIWGFFVRVLTPVLVFFAFLNEIGVIKIGK